MTDAELKKIRARVHRWRKSATDFCAECLYVQTKDRKLAHLMGAGFPEQRMLAQLVDKIRAEGRPVRILGLKPRQIGMTSGSTGLIYHATSLFKNVVSQIVSSDLSSVQAIHEKNNIFWEMSDPATRPMRSRSSRREMVFANPSKKLRAERPGLRSKIFVESAAKATIGRSHTIHNFLGSEVAFWKEGSERALAAMNAVPELPGTMVIMESTANGVGDYFHKTWMAAKKKGSVWVPFFVPWNIHPEYQRECDKDWNAEDLSKEEMELKLKHNLSDQQIAWYRWALVNKCENDQDKLRQEYPLDDEEAFMASGRPAFDPRLIKAHRIYVEAGIKMRLERHSTGVYAKKDDDAELVVWEPPQVGHIYVIGADCCLGLEEGDWQAASVVDVMSRHQVAEFHSHCDSAEYAWQLAAMGFWYNEALVAPERNGDGFHVIARLKDIYPNIYQYESIDRHTKKPSVKFGWQSNDDSNRVILQEMRNGLRHNEVLIRSGPLLDEAEKIQRDQHGRYYSTRAEGNHDDRPRGFAIAYWIARSEAMKLLQMQTSIVDNVRVRLPIEERVRGYARRQRGQVSYTEI